MDERSNECNRIKWTKSAMDRKVRLDLVTDVIKANGENRVIIL